MNKRIRFTDFSKGLHLSGQPELMPAGTTLRNRGMHAISDGEFRRRDGSTQLYSTNNVHSLFYFADVWYYGASTIFYSAGSQIKSGLSGDRLSFTRTPPVAGISDYLFVCDTDELFKASSTDYPDGTELITNGTMEADANWSNYGTPGTNERSSTQAHGSTYSRKFTPDAANEGIQGDTFTTVSNAWYYVVAYVYPDDDTDVRIRIRAGDDSGFTYNTLHGSLTENAWNEITFVYQETTGGANAYIVFESDDATSGDWYIDDVSIQRTYYALNWGIVPPGDTMAAADGGSGGNLDDGAVYGYLATFYNSITGTRSNPTTAALPSSTDPYTKLLLHCEGSDAGQTFTDTSPPAHTVTAQNSANTDDAQKKFGSTSGEFESGTTDYLTIPASIDWYFGSSEFTIDMWVRFESLPAAGNHMAFYSQHVDATTYIFFGVTNAAGTYYVNAAVVINGALKDYIYKTHALVVDTWYHMAWIRGWQGNTSRWVVAVDGTSGTLRTSTNGMPYLAAQVQIAARNGAYLFDGWIDEIRVSKGVARWTADFTPPTVAYSDAGSGGAYIELAGGSTSVDLTNIPSSTDPQVDQVELWRTEGGGSTYYLLTRLANGTTSYTDDTSDSDLQTTECPTDNLKPYFWFDDCASGYNASTFWITRQQVGERGRIYYSPIGRAEAVQGFINACGDDLGLQKIVLWRGTLFVFGQDGLYQVYGTNPYYSRKMSGVPGTNSPGTVVVTPLGIVYEAPDGVRVFDGATSFLLSSPGLTPVFRGLSAGQLTSFSGVVATYGRNEYLISDGAQLLAFDVSRRRWRDIGLATTSLFYAEDVDILGAGTTTDGVYNLENEGDLHDNATDLSIALETYHVRIGDDRGGVVKQVYVDHDSSSETLTVTLVHDGTATSLGTVSSSSRDVDSLPANRAANEFGIRITGTVDTEVIIYGIYADAYLRGEEFE